jgi:orotidine-5'-phosphate decarboxylase
MLNDELGIPGTISSAVQRYAFLAQSAGLDGVVAAADEVPIIQRVCGPAFLTVVPGIRPSFYQTKEDDQRRVATPAEARRRGATFLVIGRPILRSPDLRQAAEAVLTECAGACSGLSKADKSSAYLLSNGLTDRMGG